MADETNTPQHTLNAATQENALPRRGLALLGTFVRSKGSQALVRLRSGRVARVAEGDRVDGARVAAIEPGAIVLARDGTATRLRMPRG